MSSIVCKGCKALVQEDRETKPACALGHRVFCSYEEIWGWKHPTYGGPNPKGCEKPTTHKAFGKCMKKRKGAGVKE